MARPKKRSPKRAPKKARVSVSAADRARRARERLAQLERDEADRIRRWEETVRADATRRRQLAQSLSGKLYLALEALQDRVFSRFPTQLTTRIPKSSYDSEYEAGVKVTPEGRRNWRGAFVWKSPWAIVGRFAFKQSRSGSDVGYADLYEILSLWDTAAIRKRVDGDRFCRIRVEYVDASTGERGEYTLSETFAWQYGIRRAIAECDPDRSRSLAGRYKESIVTAVIIWLSSSTQRDQTTFVGSGPKR